MMPNLCSGGFQDISMWYGDLFVTVMFSGGLPGAEINHSEDQKQVIATTIDQDSFMLILWSMATTA